MLLAHMAAAFALSQEILNRVAGNPAVQEAPHFFDWVEPVNACLAHSLNMGTPVSSSVQPPTDAVMTSLSFTAWLLGQDGRRMPTAEQVADVMALLRELEDEVGEGDMHEELRLYLLEHIRRMQAAVRLVDLRGADALRDAAEAGMGGAVFWAKTEGRDPWTERLWEAATKVATVAQLATTGVAIGAGTLGALPG